MLTQKQIHRIKQIIDDHMNAVMKLTVGTGKPSDRLVSSLDIPSSVRDLISSSYLYGKAGTISESRLASLTPAQVEKILADIKVTPAEQASIDALRSKTSLYIDKLKQNITTNVLASAMDSDLQMWEAVRDVVPGAIAQHHPINQVAAELRDKSGDMFRDWHRVAQTEMWGAKCQGEVESILRGESPMSKDGANTEVYIKPAPDACSKCKQLYLERDGITPRVFSLAELLSNGNNNGKKQADWTASIPPLHPNCRCTLNVKPANTEFDGSGRLVYQRRKPTGKQ